MSVSFRNGNMAKTTIIEPKTATMPWFWPAAHSHLGGDRNNAKTFNTDQRFFILGIYRTNITISNAVHTFIDHVLRNAVDIKVNVLGKEIKINSTNDELTEYFTDVIMPGIEKIFYEWILFGYARVKIIPRQKDEIYPSFVVLPEGLTEEVMWWDKNDKRQYEMRYNQMRPGDKGGKIVEGGLLLIMNEPHDDGWLNSPVARATTQIATETRLWQYYISASFTQARQPYIFSPDAEKSSQALQRTTTVADGMASLEGTTAARRAHSRVVSLQAMQQAKAASMHAQNAGAASIDIQITTLRNPLGNDPSNKNIPYHIKAAEITEPWKNGFTTMAGHKLNQPPRVTAPEKFLEVIESILHKVLRAIGIPPEMLSSGGKQHAANVELVQNELRNNIQRIQTKGAPLLRLLFKKLFEESLDITIYNHAKKNNKENDSKFLKEKKSEVKVEVQFQYNSIMTAEQLFLYHEKGVISTETMQEYALRNAGMPQSAMLKNSDKELAKRATLFAKAEAAGKPKPNDQFKNGTSTTTTTSTKPDGTKSTSVKKSTSSTSPNDPSKKASTSTSANKRKSPSSGGGGNKSKSKQPEKKQKIKK